MNAIGFGNCTLRKNGAKNFKWHRINCVYMAPVRLRSKLSAKSRPIKFRCPIMSSQWNANPGTRLGCRQKSTCLKMIVLLSKNIAWSMHYPKASRMFHWIGSSTGSGAVSSLNMIIRILWNGIPLNSNFRCSWSLFRAFVRIFKTSKNVWLSFINSNYK